MKKLLIVVLMMAVLASSAFAAELLIKAEDAWGTDEARSRKGDIIVVRPDGWIWGKEECLPRFIVVKLKGVKVEDIKHYEQPLWVFEGVDELGNVKQRMLKRRQYSIGSVSTDSIRALGGNAELSKAVFDAQLIDKAK